MLGDQRLTHRGLELIAGKFKALSDPTRLAVMQTLMQGEKSVTEIVEVTGASQPNVSRHLGVLHRAGLVARRKCWPHCIYSIADATIEDVCRAMCDTVAQHDEPIFE
ncbi:MAG: metalloregulator ArsR/SmtB family transcription factor [Armatimonadia bacterium]|nr:metalloregulator ArsR/SmtB family transcription factor [Armatimonadia bacterium]